MPGQLEGRFRDYFTRWRLKEAKNEELRLKTAVEIANYVSSALNIEKINQELKDSYSPPYKKFASYGELNYGSLLYCKLILEVYIEDSGLLRLEESEEKILLEKITYNIAGLYLESRVQTQEKLEGLVKNSTLWLEKFTANRNNPEHVKYLCCAFYVFLKTLTISLSQYYPWAKKATAKLVGIELDVFEEALKDLLEQISKKVSQLQTEILPTVLSSPQTVAEYLNERYLQLLKQESMEDADSVLQKIDTLKDYVLKVMTLVTTLQRNHELRSQIALAQTILTILHTNEHQVTGRKYFLELLQNNEDSFKLFIANLEEDSRREVLKKIDQLKKPDGYQQMSASIQYVGSWLTALPASTMRLTMSEQTQDAVISILPQTLDSECKAYVKSLATSYIHNLGQALNQNEDQLKKLIKTLSAGQSEFEKLLTNLSAEVLPLRAATEGTIASLEAYKQLLQLASNRQEKLREIESLDIKAAAFLSAHDSFLIKLCKFLSQFFGCFAIKEVEQVDVIKEIKRKLGLLREEYHDFFMKEIETFKETSTLSLNLKNHIVKQLEMRNSINPGEPVTNLLSEDCTRSYTAITQRFFKLRQELSEDDKEMRNDSNMGILD
ncbi:purine NTPase, putative [Legionella lansingensis]|uniref:Purine NTPase n=1 Tax=Legionella lansingensis TaxID=45067 RepID=A0A0W0VPI4_9GAMM|nr:hypothetical protein [Legionella lansingensis]KTD22023.1 purine NTPase [Legionella lansingensis]SNV54020.1 purine NTPase, putative [Legionella lansingensis]